MSCRADDAMQVLRFWQAVAIFSPQQLPTVDPRAHVVEVRPGEPMPWEPGSRLESEPIEPDRVWRHEVFGGVFEVRKVRDVLVRLYETADTEQDEQAPARGDSALFGCTVGADGLLVEQSAVLSNCAWAVGRILHSGWPATGWMPGFRRDEQRYGNDLGLLAGSKWEDGARFLRSSMRTAFSAAVQQGVQAAVTGALGPVAGPLAVAGGAAAGSVAGDFARAATGQPRGQDSAEKTAEPLPRLDLHPLIGRDLERFTDALAKRLGVAEELTPRGIRVRSYLVSSDRASEPPQQTFLNSFYLDDLIHVSDAFSAGDVGEALGQYLTDVRRPGSSKQVDVQVNPRDVRAGNQPQRIPSGRWVTSTDRTLVFSQQFAVNQIMGQLERDPGLLAVNGPPGTGKTTMLRDVVAAIVVERAIRIAKLKAPCDAFPDAPHEWKHQMWTHYIKPLRQDLTGFEVVVASSNNGAVENVTTEIPGPNAVAAQWRSSTGDLDYFSATAELLYGKGAWAMIAARLGNYRNRTEFVDKFWRGKFGQNRGHPRDADAGMQGVLKQMRAESAGDWASAVADFRHTLEKVRGLTAERQVVASAIERRSARNNGRVRADKELRAATHERANLQERQVAFDAPLHEAEARYQSARSKIGAHQQSKPGLLISLSTGFRAGREWRAEHRNLRKEMADATENRSAVHRTAQQLNDQITIAEQRIQRAQNEFNQVSDEISDLGRQITQQGRRWGPHVPSGPEYWETTRADLIEKRETSTPWGDEEYTAARTELFIAALRLHKVFIAAEASTIGKNLNAMMDIIRGSHGRPRPAATLAAWQTFFLVVPVVSSTFASFDRLFAGLGRESLGWLFIDEAGQAAPYEAAGAIWRAKRAVVVGDPLQLEPVVTLPWGGQQALLEKFDVPEDWAPSRTSVQSVADRLAHYGTWLPSTKFGDTGHVWVGTPLRVHRRCDEPMFKICNEIAYEGLMVYGTGSRPDFVGRSVWYDVRSNDAQGNWIPAEGEVLRQVLDELKRSGISPSEIRVLSPFRRVVEGAKKDYRKIFSWDEVSDRQRDQWVGTVHTMQGKEADVVILVLGTHPNSVRARGWAASSPNLLNVAVSRARRRLYVIGNAGLWSSLKYFDVLASELPSSSSRTTS